MTDAIVLISPNAIAREGLRQIIASGDFTVASSGAAAAEIDWGSCSPDVMAVIDTGHRPSQADAVADVLAHHPDARCVVLVDQFNFEGMLQCFQNDARGYIVKDMPCPQLIAALRLASLGECVLPSDLLEIMLRQPSYAITASSDERQVSEAHLTHRELDVLCCLTAGFSNKLIARQLNVTEATVKVHVKAILRKLKVGNRTQAAMWGTVRGMSAQNSAGVLN
jgi:two-component system nitrate/nitrite response regulator NarL